MRRAITAVLGIGAAAFITWAQADVTVLAVRLPAKNLAELAKFYDTAFGLKQIDQVGTRFSTCRISLRPSQPRKLQAVR